MLQGCGGSAMHGTAGRGLAGGHVFAEYRVRPSAANSRRTLLVAALSGRPEELLRATEDRLHQEYRRPAMPESLALVEALRADGVPAVVSGAGPTVLAFADGPGTTSADALLARCPDGWQAHALAVTGTGAALADLR